MRYHPLSGSDGALYVEPFIADGNLSDDVCLLLVRGNIKEDDRTGDEHTDGISK